MARNEQRRQKKLLAKRTKRQEEKRSIARAESSGFSGAMTLSSQWPVTRACVSATLWEQGIGYAALVRRGPSGLSAQVIFLLDVFCLGVKDVLGGIAQDYEIADRLSHMGEKGCRWAEVSPEHVRKLVEGTLGYALSLGLAPHPDCSAALKMFGNLDAAKCTTEFTFGSKGKPYFMPGPYDSPARITEVLRTLRRTCGPDGFHYTVPLSDAELPDDLAGALEGVEGRIVDLDAPDPENAEVSM